MEMKLAMTVDKLLSQNAIYSTMFSNGFHHIS